MEAMTLHWYPNYIIDPIHKMRSMKIIVKENATFDGNKEEFKKALDTKSSEISEIVNNNANLWASGKKVSDIDTVDILPATYSAVLLSIYAASGVTMSSRHFLIFASYTLPVLRLVNAVSACPILRS